MKCRSNLITRLWGSFRASPPPLFMTAQTRKDGSMRIGLKTTPGPSNTPSQIEWRARYSACVDEWNIMSPEQKEEYSEVAKATGITNYNAFISACLLVPMATEVYQSDPTKLKGIMKITKDGINFMPSMDAKGRRGYVQITDGINTMPTMHSLPTRGFVQLTDGDNGASVLQARHTHVPTNYGVSTIPFNFGRNTLTGEWHPLGGVYDYLTDTLSLATSRGAGKSTFTDEYDGVVTDDDIIELGVGDRLMIAGIMTMCSGDTGYISLDFEESERKVWRHYVDKFHTLSGMDLSIVGGDGEALTLNIAGVTGNTFVLINYREIGGLE